VKICKHRVCGVERGILDAVPISACKSMKRSQGG
jgi:hypothetical protein